MSEKICGIYKITNLINGKVYIGQSRDIKRRWSSHRSDFLKDKKDYVLYRAFRKYGIENFSFEVIEKCSENELDEKEKFYIAEYDSFLGDGYNMTLGGQGVIYPMTEEYRIKQSRNSGGEPIIQLSLDGEYIKEFFSTAEAERVLNIPHENIIKVLNGDYKSTGNYIFVRKALYDPAKIYRCQRVKDARPVKQYSLEGIFIREYKNEIEASKLTGICNVSISAVCCHKGKHKTAGGFQWVFVGDEQSIRPIKPWEKPVDQYDKNGVFLNHYETIKQACAATNINNSSITHCCRGRQKSAGGFVWRYSCNQKNISRDNE